MSDKVVDLIKNNNLNDQNNENDDQKNKKWKKPKRVLKLTFLFICLVILPFVALYIFFNHIDLFKISYNYKDNIQLQKSNNKEKEQKQDKVVVIDDEKPQTIDKEVDIKDIVDESDLGIVEYTYNNNKVVKYDFNKIKENKEKLFEKGYFNFSKESLNKTSTYFNLLNNDVKDLKIYDLIDDQKDFKFNKYHVNILGVGNGSIISYLKDKNQNPWFVILTANHVVQHEQLLERNRTSNVQIRYGVPKKGDRVVNGVVEGKIHGFSVNDELQQTLKDRDLNIFLFEVLDDVDLKTDSNELMIKNIDEYFVDIKNQFINIENLTYFKKQTINDRNYLYSYRDFLLKKDTRNFSSFYNWLSVKFDTNDISFIKDENKKPNIHSSKLSLTNSHPGDSGASLYYFNDESKIVINGILKGKLIWSGEKDKNEYEKHQLLTKYKDSVDLTILEDDFAKLSNHIDYIKNKLILKDNSYSNTVSLSANIINKFI